MYKARTITLEDINISEITFALEGVSKALDEHQVAHIGEGPDNLHAAISLLTKMLRAYLDAEAPARRKLRKMNIEAREPELRAV